jgi:hypothetical protein
VDGGGAEGAGVQPDNVAAAKSAAHPMTA